MSKNFLSHFYRLSSAGIIILASTYLGAVIYINTTPEIKRIELKDATANIEKGVRNGIDINIDGEIVKLSGQEISSWTENYIRDYTGRRDTRLNTFKILDYIKAFAPMVNTEPANAKFEYKDDKVNIFQAGIPGKKLDIHSSVFAIVSAIRKGEETANLVIETIEPTLTLEKVNSLGINTLLGQGESSFKDSSSSRIHNIKVGAAKFNGLILKPGEEFSFNKTLGEVDGTSGYQAELVIKGGKLIYEYGGGICQVSTTLFRSAIYAGLPIIERKPHSFPVRHYNPQGFDSTIYPGITDLKFINNTPNHILIQNRVEGTKLTFEIYGSSDGRNVSIQGPFQYDQKPNGSLKAYFIRDITHNDGTTKTERFDSFYGAPLKSPLARNPLE